MDVQALKDSINKQAYFEQHLRPVHRSGDEWQCHCPFHQDKNPSLSVNVSTGLWKCHSCNAGGDLIEFEKMIHSCDFKTAVKNLGGDNVIPLRAPVQKSRPAPDTKAEPVRKIIPVSVAEQYHQALLSGQHENVLEFLAKKRGFARETIISRLIGFDSKRQRISVPVFDEQRDLVNIRMYHPKNLPKMLPWETGYGKVRWYPVENLAEPEIVVCEGEFDTILACQLGIPAITQTGGARTFEPKWAHLFADKRVWICYDHDDAGREGAEKAASIIAPAAAEVRIIQLPVLSEKEDFTDWVMSYDGTAEAFRELMQSAPVYRPASEGATVSETEIPLEEQILALPAVIDFEEHASAWRSIIKSVARKTPAAQEKYIKLLGKRFKLGTGAIRKEIKLAELEIKLEPAIPQPLAEPRARDLALAQDMYENLLHYGIWLPTNKDDFVFRLVNSECRFEEAPEGTSPDRLPKDFGRWSVDAKTPFNVFAYVNGQAKVDAGDLFQKLVHFIRRFMWYPDDRAYELIAAWIMQTYVFMVFDQCGYLALVGTKRAGKTRLFEILEMLCFNAKLSTSVTDAYVFRAVEIDRVTLLVDEADHLKQMQKDGVNERLEILRGGYRRSGSVGRIEGEDRKRVDFSTYSPKAVANVSGLEDALEDRTIPIPVERKPKQVKVERIIHRRLKAETTILRNMLYCFGLQYAAELARLYDEVEIRGVDDREAEIWSGIITISRLAGGPEVSERLIKMAQENAERKALHEGAESVDAQEILAVWTLATEEEPDFTEGANRWFQTKRMLRAISDQLGWENFSYKRMSVDLVKFRIIEDSEGFKQRRRVRMDLDDNYGNARYRQAMCYLLRRDRIIAAAERYGVKLEHQPVAAGKNDESPF